MIIPSNKNKEQVDAAIALPRKIFTTDGRQIEITSWVPTVKAGSLITVQIEGVIIFVE